MSITPQLVINDNSLPFNEPFQLVNNQVAFKNKVYPHTQSYSTSGNETIIWTAFLADMEKSYSYDGKYAVIYNEDQAFYVYKQEGQNGYNLGNFGIAMGGFTVGQIPENPFNNPDDLAYAYQAQTKIDTAFINEDGSEILLSQKLETTGATYEYWVSENGSWTQRPTSPNTLIFSCSYDFNKILIYNLTEQKFYDVINKDFDNPQPITLSDDLRLSLYNTTQRYTTINGHYWYNDTTQKYSHIVSPSVSDEIRFGSYVSELDHIINISSDRKSIDYILYDNNNRTTTNVSLSDMGMPTNRNITYVFSNFDLSVLAIYTMDPDVPPDSGWSIYSMSFDPALSLPNSSSNGDSGGSGDSGGDSGDSGQIVKAKFVGKFDGGSF